MKYNDRDRKRIVEERGYELLEIIRERNGKGKLFVYVITKCKNGHIWKARWDNFLKKDCPCMKKEKYEDKIKNILKKYNQKLLKTEIKNDRRYVIVQCEHGHITKKIWNGNNKICGCKECQRENNTIWNEDKIIKEIEKEKYHFIKFVQSNISGEKRIKIKCNHAHESYEVYFRNWLNGKRCPHCSRSLGEEEIVKFLNKIKINYIEQYKFNDCKFKDLLPFDFYLPDYNCCIEYDGNQHFEVIEWFGGLDKFIDTKIRDTIKNEYCKKNNIKLIRIPYWKFDKIEEILKENLK